MDILVFGGITTLALLCLAFELRYQIRRLSSRRWPTAPATITEAYLVMFGRGGRGIIFDYRFSLNETHAQGKFLVLCGSDVAETLKSQLPGTPISVKYCPSAPDTSFLLDFYDSRFKGGIVTQSAYWFFQARPVPGLILLDLSGK